MAKITTNIPDQYLVKAILGLSKRYGYQEMIEDDNGDSIQNPESKMNFIKKCRQRMLIRDIEKGLEMVEKESSTAQAETSEINITVT